MIHLDCYGVGVNFDNIDIAMNLHASSLRVGKMQNIHFHQHHKEISSDIFKTLEDIRAGYGGQCCSRFESDSNGSRSQNQPTLNNAELGSTRVSYPSNGCRNDRDKAG